MTFTSARDARKALARQRESFTWKLRRRTGAPATRTTPVPPRPKFAFGRSPFYLTVRDKLQAFLSVVLSGIRHWASRFSADRTLLHPRFPLISFMR